MIVYAGCVCFTTTFFLFLPVWCVCCLFHIWLTGISGSRTIVLSGLGATASWPPVFTSRYQINRKYDTGQSTASSSPFYSHFLYSCCNVRKVVGGSQCKMQP